MPVLAIVGAAIGAEVIGGAVIAGLGLAEVGIGAALAGALGGAIGGAIGGGVNSVMQGGDFWDGAKGGALGGALGGAFQGIGGFEGIKGLIGGGGGAASSGIEAAAGYTPSVDSTTSIYNPTYGTPPSLAETVVSDVPSNYSFTGESLGQTAGLGGEGLGGATLGTIAGSTPTQGALGSSTGMKSTGQVGSQSALDSLGKYFEGQDPMKLGGTMYDYYSKSQAFSKASEDNANNQKRYNQLGNQIWNTGTSMLATAATSGNSTRDRINAVFAKYGMKGN